MIIDIEILESYLNSLNQCENIENIKILCRNSEDVIFQCHYKLINNSEDIHINIFTVNINDIKKWIRVNKLKNILE
jgi:hypothetical protein